jgi:hypothetical protein
LQLLEILAVRSPSTIDKTYFPTADAEPLPLMRPSELAFPRAVRLCFVTGDELVNASPAGVRPLLLIDVDGVLNPLAVGSESVPSGFKAYDLEGLRVLLTREHGVWLTDLAADFDLIWATSWEHDADRLLAELVGLPRGMPVITFKSPQTGWTTKLPDVIRFVGDRPMAWVDDVLGPDEHAWARSRATPTLLIQPDHRVGLTSAHIDRLRKFAVEVRRQH